MFISLLKLLLEESLAAENKKTSQSLSDLSSLGFTDRNMLSQQPGVGDNRNLFNNQLLNNLLLANSQQNMPKIENSTPQLNDIFAGLLQNSQQSLMLSMLNNPQGAMNLNQMLPQNVKSMVNQAETINEENRIKMEHTNSCEAFLKEFQAKSMSLLFSQNKMLGELKEKNDILQETLALLIGEINNIK